MAGRGAWGGDEGANAVEFALVLPILLVLIFGTITGGLTLFQKLGVEQGNREAARWAATLPLKCVDPPESPPNDCWFIEVANRAVAGAGGELDDVQPGRLVCVAYIHNDGTPRSKSVTWGQDATVPFGTDDVSSYGETCFDDGVSAVNPHVQVRVSRLGRLDLVFYGKDITLESTSVALFEPEPEYGP